MAIDSVSKFFGKGKNEDSPDQVLEINLGLLNPNPFQPRRQFDQNQMDELSRSIAEIGVIQPIVVRKTKDLYEIVAGERRWRAAKMAGQSTIPAVVRSFSDREMAEIALIENLQRADLNYFEEAEGYRKLIEDFHVTQEDLAKRMGKSQPTIANKLRLLRIDPVVKDKIWVDILSERHVRALLKLQNPEDQLIILKEIYENELTVKDTESMIVEFLEGRLKPGEDAKTEDMAEGEKTEKKQNVRRVFSDIRIYINTIKDTVNTILDTGVNIKMKQEETDEGVTLTITIPRLTK